MTEIFFDNIPEYFRSQPRWTVWLLPEWLPGTKKPKKVLMLPSGDPMPEGYPITKNTGTFDQVREACKKDPRYFPGFWILQSDKLVFLDYDGKHGNIPAIPQHPSYCERSAYGYGYHIIGWYSGPDPSMPDTNEVYLGGRWCIMTGSLVDDRRDINDLTDHLKKYTHQTDDGEIEIIEPFTVPTQATERHPVLKQMVGSMVAKKYSFKAILAACQEENLSTFKPPKTPAQIEKEVTSLYDWATRKQIVKEREKNEKKKPIPQTTAENTLTQIRIADYFHDATSGEWRYNIDMKKWFFWNGKFWEVDEKDHIKNVVKDFLRDYLALVPNLPLGKDLVDKTKFIVGLNSAKGIRDILAIAAPGMTIKDRDLDTQPYLMNCQNGTLDLKTMEFREHRSEDFISKIAGVEYLKGATCPHWEKHISTVFDDDTALIANIQELLGYSLFLGNPDAVLLVFYGSGRNGKSVTISLLNHVLGSYTVTVNPASLMDAGCNPGSDRIKMSGARLISAIEPSDGKKGRCQLDTGFIKAATGNDVLSARRLYCEGIDFKIEGLFILASNSLPRISDPSIAIWERIWMVPFNHYFGEDRDTGIIDTLKAEGPGILNWLIDGFIRYRKDRRLIQCKTIVAQTADYRHDEDFYSPFFDACVTRNEKLQISASELFGKYEKWFQEKYPGKIPATKNKFGRDMSTRFQRVHKENGYYYSGIGPLGQEQIHQDGD